MRPRSRISSALAPRTVQCTAIFSLRRIPNERTVYRAFEKTGCCPVNCSNTLAARVSLSPDSPTQMFRHNLRILTSRMTFLDASFGSLRTFTFLPGFFTGAACLASYEETILSVTQNPSSNTHFYLRKNSSRLYTLTRIEKQTCDHSGYTCQSQKKFYCYVTRKFTNFVTGVSRRILSF